MASMLETELKQTLENAGVRALWQETDEIPKLDYTGLYQTRKAAVADLYLPDANIFVEVKGQMTLHQVAKMLYLTAQAGIGYYVYQGTEEDWDPTLDALIPVSDPLPDSTSEAKRKAYNRRFQQAELVRLAGTKGLEAQVSRATAGRLRAYAAFFERHLRAATGSGFLARAESR